MEVAAENRRCDPSLMNRDDHHADPLRAGCVCVACRTARASFLHNRGPCMHDWECCGPAFATASGSFPR